MADTESAKISDELLDERNRQIEVEGHTSESDDRYVAGELAQAAGCYALSTATRGDLVTGAPSAWPWARGSWKPTDPRRDLVKAGALIIAEIERLDRKAELLDRKKTGKPAPTGNTLKLVRTPGTEHYRAPHLSLVVNGVVVSSRMGSAATRESFLEPVLLMERALGVECEGKEQLQ
jgi:hypothetical protein